ncbi:MAG: dihydrofolate reductase [bacterium]|nr:dihydrofolate reductase [bacterium]
MIVLVAAVARNRVIGVDGSLPWSIPADLQRFKALTTGKPIVMGRATYESIGRPLPQRTNIVLTRNPDFVGAGVRPAADAATALRIARQEHGENAEICVIGGGQVYSLFMPVATRMELTVVDLAPEGDVYFPPWSGDSWEHVWSERHPGPPSFEFVRFLRKPEARESAETRSKSED